MTLTTILIVLTAAILILYDITTAILRGPKTTISAVVYLLSQEYPIIPFVFGVIAGHLFWKQ